MTVYSVNTYYDDPIDKTIVIGDKIMNDSTEYIIVSVNTCSHVLCTINCSSKLNAKFMIIRGYLNTPDSHRYTPKMIGREQ